ncbi:LysM peptidoglycan-binding domain-containing protein [Aliikangiella maris]|uniref:LysM peptidoglycan-binding domain-containing protein n=2 Tax=Aliikangiella maris TaxID=3162458 RepID=A0ABV2BWY9_9GAMM
MKKITIGILSALFSLSALITSAAELRQNHPEFHVVQPGDTLWDISEKFLQSPWLWPEIWHVNDQVDNPHLIFPGDIISLVYIDGKPRITKTNRLPNGTIKLNPRARELSADSAITTIPLDAIAPFLSSAQVVTEDQLELSPYVVGSDSGRLLAAKENRVYVRGILDESAQKYTFFRKGNAYIDPETKEVLGIEAIHVAEGQKIEPGDPTVMRVKDSSIELRPGDRAWPTNDEQLRPLYFPHSPKSFEGGQIISVYGGVSQIGQFNVVVINRGDREGMEVGHVLSIYQRGKTIVDNIATQRRRDDNTVSTFEKVKDTVTNHKEHVTLPDELAGRLMIFRTFEKVSLALVLKAEKTIHVYDKVKMPY